MRIVAGDGQYHVWCPHYPGQWLAHAASCDEALRQLADSVLAYYDIHLGLPKHVLWVSLPPGSLRSGESNDLVAVTGKVERPVLFRLMAPAGARDVAVAGDFNHWTAQPLERRPDGQFRLILRLPPGFYGYRYVIDGHWSGDPMNDFLAAPRTAAKETLPAATN